VNRPPAGHQAKLAAVAHVFGVTQTSFAAAWVSYEAYEIRFLNLKRQFV